MKIRVVDLKTNLSKVLREIQSSGETLEVCVRESTVAYLTPVHPKKGETNPAHDINRLTNSLADVGLILTGPHLQNERVARPKIHRAGDDQIDITTIGVIRSEKDW